MKTLNFPLRLRMHDAPVNGLNVQVHEETLKLRISAAETGELRTVVGKNGVW